MLPNRAGLKRIEESCWEFVIQERLHIVLSLAEFWAYCFASPGLLQVIKEVKVGCFGKTALYGLQTE